MERNYKHSSCTIRLIADTWHARNEARNTSISHGTLLPLIGMEEPAATAGLIGMKK